MLEAIQRPFAVYFNKRMEEHIISLGYSRMRNFPLIGEGSGYLRLSNIPNLVRLNLWFLVHRKGDAMHR